MADVIKTKSVVKHLMIFFMRGPWILVSPNISFRYMMGGGDM